MGVAEFAKWKTDGTRINPHKVPYDIWYVPNPDLAKLWPHDRQKDETGREIPFYEQLTQIPDGSLLFEVWARDVPTFEPWWPEGSKVQHIANVVSHSKIITSNFGDTRLFFEHEFMREDFRIDPRWKRFYDRVNHDDIWGDRPIPDWPADYETAEQWVKASLSEYECPFAWLLGHDIGGLLLQ